MLRTCLRCGTHWYDPFQVAHRCICTGMTDDQAAYLNSLHNHIVELRVIGRKALHDPALLSDEDLDALGTTLVGEDVDASTS